MSNHRSHGMELLTLFCIIVLIVPSHRPLCMALPRFNVLLSFYFSFFYNLTHFILHYESGMVFIEGKMIDFSHEVQVSDKQTLNSENDKEKGS